MILLPRIKVKREKKDEEDEEEKEEKMKTALLQNILCKVIFEHLHPFKRE